MRTYGIFLRILPFALCLLFFLAYATLSLIRHAHFQSYGFDLGINDQTVWRYSIFQSPLVTIHQYPDKTKLYDHVEFVYALISPFYWIWSSRQMLLLLQSAFICSGGIAVYLLAKTRKLKESVSLAALVGYLGFYGVQSAIWFDVHSSVFGAAFLAWFLYFLDVKKLWPTILLFILSITAKENVGMYTFAIALVYFIKRRDKLSLFLMFGSFVYVSFVFFVYFPQIIHFKYQYQNTGGLFSNLNLLSLVNTKEKVQTLFYTGLSFGFLPILAPVYLLPALAHFVTFFIIASGLGGAQGIYEHYRVALAPMMSWAVILTISKIHRLNNKYVALYLFVCVLTAQYVLHLPLSYLTKSWFWQEPSGVKNIRTVEKYLPATASLVAQNNIIPHESHRDKIYELYPQKKTFTIHSPCGQKECNWFSWYGNPEYLFVDTSPEWDIRHLLANRPDFIDGLQNLEKTNVVSVYKRVGSATLYKVNRDPNDYK